MAITSRLTDNPLNLAYVAQSAAGKNAAIDVVLPLFPESAYYLIRASSPRALVYNEESFSHRTVVMTEADSLPEEGPAASAVRSLMSDQEMSYEVVEKGEDGQHHVRRIVKPGPTGLITTSTKPLGEQASTRTLTVAIPDSAEQTRLIMRAKARQANHTIVEPDTTAWAALQTWLGLAGERSVHVPFAEALAELVPDSSVRLRRDFAQLLALVQTLALLSQRSRERNERGAIVASLEDYVAVRWLLEEVFATTVYEGVTPAIRQTVETVSRLISENGCPASEQDLVKQLKLAKSTIHYRVQRAIQGGWLMNKTTQKGAPAQLVLGIPLPDGCPLPEPEELLVCMKDSQNDSNPRTPDDRPPTVQIEAEGSKGVRTGLDPDSNRGSKESQSYSGRRFERFEPIRDVDAHTQRDPWDSFLEEAES